MKKYIKPSTETHHTAPELMLGMSDDVGTGEFANYGEFDEDLSLPKPKNKLWDD